MEQHNLELLVELCSIQSSASEDTDIMNFIKKYITDKLSLTYTEDSFGNIYVTKGSGKNGYKAVVSHTDTVHSIYGYRKVFYDNGYLFAMGCLNENSVLKQVGIGGDDRVGNFVCLKALEDFDDIKAVFFRFEETGCRGSKAANMSFFDDCNFVVQADRKGYGDFIRNSKGIEMCSNEFVEEMRPIFEKYQYKIVAGISTDVNQLKENGLKICAINLGCGYYDPHSNNEVIYVPNLAMCYSMITEMFNTYGNKSYEHLYVKPTYSYESRSYGRSFSGKPIFSGSSDFIFSNTKDKNFFKQRLIEDLFVPISTTDNDIIDKLTEGLYKDFWSIDGEKDIYYYTDTKPIVVKNKFVYNPMEDIFYDLKDNNFVKNPTDISDLHKEMSVIDTDTEFVYSIYYQYWIKRNSAVWNNVLDTWVLKGEKF